MIARTVGVALALAAYPALAAPAELLVSRVDAPDAAGRVIVEVTLLNTGGKAQADAVPPRIEARLTIAGETTRVVLERADADAAGVLAPGAFTRARYCLPAPQGRGGAAVLSLGASGGFAFTLVPEATFAGVPASVVDASSAPAKVAPPARDAGNPFLANLTGYEPIFAVYGPGTGTAALLQISFKYQLFGRGPVTGWSNALNGIQFGYAQRLFWDVEGRSSPFRNVDYMPEIAYFVASQPIAPGWTLGGHIAARHESNGRSGIESRSANEVYIQTQATVALGNGWNLSAGPRLWTYVGDLSDNPGIGHFRGNTGLFFQVGKDDGLRVSTNSRFNFASGKGAIDAQFSYPLDRLVWSKLNLYHFGQAFVGYGENLLDYDRNTTRVRAGIGIVR